MNGHNPGKPLPVLIIGAGLGGLTFAHALQKHSIPFLIFERDPALTARAQGWGLTIHWALSDLRSLLPDSLSARLDDTQVDPAQGRHDNGNFLFLDLSNGAVKWRIPPAERRRISRDRFRRLLLEEGMEARVHWGKRLRSFARTDAGVRAAFDDGTSYEGFLLVGVDGAASTVRSLLLPVEMHPLPVRFLGVSLTISAAQVAPLLALDPLLFQGCDPHTRTYMWFSVMDTPVTMGEDRWQIQVCLSWLAADSNEIPPTDAERVQLMKAKAAGFVPSLKAIFADDILKPEHSPVISINMVDWVPPTESWDYFGGRVTLAGDAAHTMTMYRGEAFNHAILDLVNLLTALRDIYDPSASDIDGRRRSAIHKYELELRERGRQAVLLSRNACLEAHQWDKLNEHSAVLKRRTR